MSSLPPSNPADADQNRFISYTNAALLGAGGLALFIATRSKTTFISSALCAGGIAYAGHTNNPRLAVYCSLGLASVLTLKFITYGLKKAVFLIPMGLCLAAIARYYLHFKRQ